MMMMADPPKPIGGADFLGIGTRILEELLLKSLQLMDMYVRIEIGTFHCGSLFE